MKKPKTPDVPPPIPPVREDGKEIAEKRKKQLMTAQNRSGVQDTLMSRTTNNAGGSTLG